MKIINISARKIQAIIKRTLSSDRGFGSLANPTLVNTDNIQDKQFGL